MHERYLLTIENGGDKDVIGRVDKNESRSSSETSEDIDAAGDAYLNDEGYTTQETSDRYSGYMNAQQKQVENSREAEIANRRIKDALGERADTANIQTKPSNIFNYHRFEEFKGTRKFDMKHNTTSRLMQKQSRHIHPRQETPLSQQTVKKRQHRQHHQNDIWENVEENSEQSEAAETENNDKEVEEDDDVSVVEVT